MTIQPLSDRPRKISVTEAIEPAYERVKMMLFRPFDFSKWIVIGFCAWLAGLGESGGFSGGYNGFNGWNNQNSAPSGDHFRQVYQQAREYVLANLAWIVPLAIIVMLVLLAIWLLVLWLNSRGKFMFLHCVVWNKAEVQEPWREYAGPANSLFRFRVILALLGMLCILPILAAVVAVFIKLFSHEAATLPAIFLIVGLVMVMLLIGLVFALIHNFTSDFVAPVQFLRRSSCFSAWREFWGLLAANPGKFTVYILFKIVLAMAIQALLVAAIVATCCIPCCLLVLPFAGTVLLLPVLTFKRAYSIYYFAQYGPEYDVFPKPPASQTPPGAPLSPLAPVA